METRWKDIEQNASEHWGKRSTDGKDGQMEKNGQMETINGRMKLVSRVRNLKQ